MQHKHSYSGIIWGAIILAVGILYLGNNMNLWDFTLFFDGWWTLFLIVPGLVSAVNDRPNFGNVFVVLLGLLLLVDAQGLFTFNAWDLFLPLVIIGIGASIFFGAFNRRKHHKHVSGYQETVYETKNEGNTYYYDSNDHSKKSRPSNVSNEDYPTHSSIFGGYESSNFSQNLKGADLNAYFGACEMDFSQAIITSDIVISTSAVFGGVEIILPRDINVVVHAKPFLGGVSNDNHKHRLEGRPTVIINATAVFGGVDIK